MHYIVHYNEIGLKGKNLPYFENMLIRNIKKQVNVKSIKKLQKRIILETDDATNLSNVFGIEWYAPCFLFKDYSSIKNFNFEIGDSFKVFCKRAYKKFNMTSQEICCDLGAFIQKKYKKQVKMKNFDTSIFLEVLKNNFILYFNKIKGPGGLPIGVSGKGLCLFSGGIDSPVAAYQMMKRGMKVDFLHVYSQPFEKVKSSKIFKIIDILSKYQPNTTLYLVSFDEFYKASSIIPKKYKSFIFRIFIFLLAKKINNVLISGDALSQVASQTLNNLEIINSITNCLIFRPLISFDKKEIIELSKKIGTYEESIKPYKDACSFLSPSPITHAKHEIVEKILKEIKIEEIIKKSLKNKLVFSK